MENYTTLKKKGPHLDHSSKGMDEIQRFTEKLHEKEPLKYYPTITRDDYLVSYGIYKETPYNVFCEKCQRRELQKVSCKLRSETVLSFASLNSNNKREFHNKEDNCLKLGFFKSGNRSRHSSGEIPHICERWIKYIRTHKMTGIVAKCITVVLLLSCFGYLLGKSTTYKDDGSKVKIGGPHRFYLKNILMPVSKSEFTRRAKNAHSYHDILRIFIKNKDISDQEIDDFIQRKRFTDLDQESVVKKDYMEDDYEPYLEDPQDMWTKAADHFEEVHSSPLASCRDPKPELVYIPSEGNKIFTPEYTILHRCRNTTGCCWNRSQTCGVKSIQVVEKFFIVLRTVGGGEQIPHDEMVESKLLLNHTECECQDLTPLPGCDQRCPHPFRKQRRSEHCTCECPHDTLPCLKIKYGISPLGAEEFQCIKDGQCMKPECDAGDFDMRKGYCPGSSSRPAQLRFRSKRHVNISR